MWEQHAQGYALVQFWGWGGGADTESRRPLRRQLAGRWGGPTSSPPMGEPGGCRGWQGHQHLCDFRRLARGERNCCLPPPRRQLLAAFRQHLVGADWVPGPGWTAPSHRGPPCAPASQPGQRLPEPAEARALGGAPAPALGAAPGQAPRPRGIGSPAREVGSGREGAGSHQLPPPLPGLRLRTWWWRQGEGGGVRARGDGVTRFGGADGGDWGALSAPSHGSEPDGRPGRARGQAGPPTRG